MFKKDSKKPIGEKSKPVGKPKLDGKTAPIEPKAEKPKPVEKPTVTEEAKTENPKPIEKPTPKEESKTEKPANLLEKPKANFEDTPGVDLCFMLDCTGSMGPYIQLSCNKIKDIINQFKEIYPCSEIRVGIVGYRDVQDPNRFDILPFTYCGETAKNFLDGLNANGGGDTPEDVNGAFQKTLFTMEWKMPVKFVVHIADAPCHGRSFHNCDDSHPKGYTEDLAWAKIFKELVEKRIDYMFLKISDTTNKMFQKFKEFADKQGATQADISFEQELSLYDEQKKMPVGRSLAVSSGAMKSGLSKRSKGVSYAPTPASKSEAVNHKIGSLFAEKISSKVAVSVNREMMKKK